MDKDILDDLKDLKKQAETEQSHYYVASCCRRAIMEIEGLRRHAAGLEQIIDGYRKLAR